MNWALCSPSSAASSIRRLARLLSSPSPFLSSLRESSLMASGSLCAAFSSHAVDSSPSFQPPSRAIANSQPPCAEFGNICSRGSAPHSTAQHRQRGSSARAPEQSCALQARHQEITSRGASHPHGRNVAPVQGRPRNEPSKNSFLATSILMKSLFSLVLAIFRMSSCFSIIHTHSSSNLH